MKNIPMPRRRLLVILSELPYPPRDGVTYPIAHYLDALRESWDIDLLLVSTQEKKEIAAEDKSKNRAYFQDWMEIASPAKSNVLAHGFRELFFNEPSFTTPVSPQTDIQQVLDNRAYDIVLTSPAHMAPWADAVAAVLPERPKLVLGLNDAITQKHRRFGDLALLGVTSFRSRCLQALHGLRVTYLPRVERQLLKPFDLVTVQTPRDRDAIVADCGQDFAERLLVVPNGAKEDLFSLPYTGADRKRLLHLGSLTQNRGQLLMWFLRKVFVRVKREIPELTIDLVGPFDENASRQFSTIKGVNVRGFAADIRDAFAGATMSVIPLFMRGGLVNKVVDSMAAGVPCSGIGAFNGFVKFQHGVHGFDVRSADEWTETLIENLTNAERLRTISIAAREMVGQEFQWNTTQARVSESFEVLAQN